MNKRDPEVHRYWVRTIISEGMSRLNDWEHEFITDMKLRTDSKFQLTDRQEQTLEKIYERITR